MKYEVFCDESSPELFVKNSNQADSKNALIGSLWFPQSQREIVKESINTLRKHHNKWGEIKWTKVSPSSLNFYRDIVDVALKNSEIKFRSIVIDAEKLDIKRFHMGDAELGFYKFYYQLIVHKINKEDSYELFFDDKVNRDPTRLKTLQKILNNKYHKENISGIHAVDSKHSVPVQLCDVLLGATQYRFNRPEGRSSAKEDLVTHIEKNLGKKIGPTQPFEEKFNVFKIRLDRGAGLS